MQMVTARLLINAGYKDTFNNVNSPYTLCQTKLTQLGYQKLQQQIW